MQKNEMRNNFPYAKLLPSKLRQVRVHDTFRRHALYTIYIIGITTITASPMSIAGHSCLGILRGSIVYTVHQSIT